MFQPILVFIIVLTGFAAFAEDCQCTAVQPVEQVLPANGFITRELIVKYLPTNLTPTMSSNVFIAQFQTGVTQKIAEDVLKGDLFRKSALGKATEKVEKMSQTSVALGSSNGTPIKIDFQVKVVEKQAVVTYKGKINSELIYAIDQHSVRWVLSKPIASETTIAWTNTADTSGGSGSSILSFSRTF